MAKQRQMNHQQLRLANPVLPSDSIIYGDINQVHALSRHQSRYQQTSFELQEETYRNTKSDQGKLAHFNSLFVSKATCVIYYL